MEKCFVAMPMSVPKTASSKYEDKDHFKHVYEHLFVPVIKGLDYEPINPESKGSEIIHADIIRNLNQADLVLCDLSTLNANVFFELGIRTALNKPVCLVADNATPEFPFDTVIINRHTYEAVLRIWNIEDERSKLACHMKASIDKAKGCNALWRHFGIEETGELRSGSYTEADKFDLLFAMVRNMTHALSTDPMRGFNPNLDNIRVQNWAAEHNAQAFDMGPRNYQRCLFDLGLKGGAEREITFNEDGTLKYQ